MAVYLGSNKVGINYMAEVEGSGGSASNQRKDVNFFDYNGTIVASYTAAEALALESLPENPSHEGLVAQGWNYTLAQIKTEVNAIGKCDIGQMYITESGDTEIDVSFVDAARLSPIMTIAVNGTITIDWGDETAADTVTGTSLTTRQAPTHTYTSTGDYIIKIHVVSGSFQFYGSSIYLLLRKDTTANQNRVYSNCIKNIRLGNGITSIGSSAFYNCYSLASITISSVVTSIGSSAFYGCYSLSSITIPSGVTSIGSSVFSNCYSLSSITIPSVVTSIGSSAFYNCYSLSLITISSGVTSIGSSAFSYCYSLASITIPSGVTTIEDSIFNDCYSLVSITIPSGVTSIKNSAFYSCYSLASIIIPSGVTSIESTVFYGCSCLSSITIPSGVTSIGNSTFSNCYGVAEYHILSTTVPTGGTTMFNNIVSDCIIYVPSELLSDYQAAENWSTYVSYMQGE